MSDIDIFPIFNQAAPGIWDDFMRIRMATMRFNYDIVLSDSEIARALGELRAAWSHSRFCFAFGAYDGAQMIGYIHGDCSRGTAYIRHLYVMPKYQRQHIGRRLLSMAESATALNNTYTDLVSLADAEPFYRQYGYIAPLKTNKYIKNIRGGGRCQTLPLFCCPASVSRVCSELSRRNGADFNPDFIRRKHSVAFVYCDINSDIAGYCIPHPDNDSQPLIFTRSGSTNCVAYGCLLRRFNSYKAQASRIVNGRKSKGQGG